MTETTFDVSDADVLWMQSHLAKLGVEVDEPTARSKLYSLLRQVELTWRPIPKEQGQE